MSADTIMVLAIQDTDGNHWHELLSTIFTGRKSVSFPPLFLFHLIKMTNQELGCQFRRVL